MVNNFSITFHSRLQRLKEEGYLESGSVEIVPSVYTCPFDFSAYPRFVSLIASVGDRVKPRLRPLNWTMKLIESIYDSRYQLQTLVYS